MTGYQDGGRVVSNLRLQYVQSVTPVKAGDKSVELDPGLRRDDEKTRCRDDEKQTMICFRSF